MFFNVRLLKLLEGLRLRVFAAAALGILAVGAGIARFALAGIVIADVFAGKDMSELAPWLVGILALIVLRAVLQYAKEAVSVTTAGLVKVRLRRQLYEHAVALGPGQLDNVRSGEVALSVVSGVEDLETFFGRYLPQLIIALVAPILIFGLMIAVDARTGLVFCFFALLSLALPSIFERANRRSSAARRVAYAELAADFLDGTQGLSTLKALGQSRAWGDRLALRARKLYKETMAVLAVNLTTTGASMFCVTAGSAVALVWGAHRVENGDLPLRTLAVVLLLGVEVFRPLRDMTRLFHDGMNAMSAAQGIFRFMDTAPAVTSPESPAPVGALDARVSFDKVRFAYQGGDRSAIEDVSFVVEPGQTVGIVGPSGAGKSTLVALLMRFYDPQAGRISIGGRDLRELSIDALRARIAVVSQDTYLFQGTVADNLRLGRPGATQAQIEDAARAANVHAFINELPAGYETIVGERGARLSGGQRQRIAIARALLKDAPILLLDEALSSVDSENEGIIQEALEKLQTGRTTLVIAHRLSSVINADKIVVLEQGVVVEEGRHAELMAAGGQYARLFSRQQTYGDEEDDDVLDEEHETAAVASTAPARVPAALEVEDERIANPALLRRLLGLVRPWAGEMGLTVLLGLLNQLSVVALALAGALLVSHVATGEATGTYVIALLVIVPLTAVFTWAEMWAAHDLAYRLLAELRINLYERLAPLMPAYAIRRRSGDISSVMAGDIETIEIFFAHTITPTICAVLIPGATLLALAVIAWPVALALLPCVLIVAFSPLVGQKMTERASRDVRIELGEVHAHAVDTVQGMREIVAFGAGAARADEIAVAGRKLEDKQLRLQNQQSLQMVVTDAVMGLGSLFTLVIGAALVTSGRLTSSQLPIVTMLAIATFNPVVDVSRVIRGLAQTLASARRLFAIHDEPVLVLDGAGAPAVAATVDAPSVDFEAVTFAYERGAQPAVRDVSFDIKPGQTVALVGRSGAGKTTAANLLLRFWDPDTGDISVAHEDVRDFRLEEELHRMMAWVSQDTYLFNMSLRENIRLGRPEATDDEVEEAARGASIHDFIMSLPEGYETKAGERGVQLSGGQRQRLSIARALVMDAPVMVLDEATSHLDAENEEQVRTGVHRLTRDRTTVVIAHRLSTIRDSDSILVLDDGRLAESGTHDELIAEDGIYAQLVRKQLVRAGDR